MHRTFAIRLLVIMLCLVFAACGDEQPVKPVVVTYFGEMYADFTPGAVEGDATDKIIMTIEEGTRYSILNLTRETRGMFPPICDSDGRWRTISTDTVQLRLTDVVTSGDCSSRVPEGLFLQIRPGNADSLIIESLEGATTFFRLDLRRVNISASPSLIGP